MGKNNLKDFQSLKNLKTSMEDTCEFIISMETQIIATKAFLDFTKAKERPEYQKFKKNLEIEDKQMIKLYELGFIALFANFECFMFEFLKDLFIKYPESFITEKIFKFDDIQHLEKIDEIKNFLVDMIAIDKSYELDKWLDFIFQKYEIKLFSDKKALTRFKALNALRNIMLHSGGKTNSKFSKDMKKFIQLPVPIGNTVGLDRKTYFLRLNKEIADLIKDMEQL